ncbi:MAG: deoxyuridine 5'-triphosphate nucleotidohydrolase [Desulfobacterales bacterium SG8_35_2]|nr:MAG: deoxyuridine 5'-triphosphate nucleotidohydrolase [Desulfobacterales bacterium SG8_35_2]
MNTVAIKINWLDPESAGDLNLPAYHSAGASGMDVAAAVEEPIELAPGEIKMIPTNFAVAIPPGYEIQVRPRSGLAIKHGVTIINSPGTIDADYRGEIKIGLINLGSTPYTIQRGDRVAQLVVATVQRADLQVAAELDKTVRQTGGFGHTGK